MVDAINGDLVIQEGVKQSETLAKLNADSVNTLRVLSLLHSDGNCKILSTLLRMGLKGTKVDNASSGGISIGVQDDGRLNDFAYSNVGIRYYEHPTSHISFNNVIIPNFEGVKKAVKILHPKFPHFRMISWDIAMNEHNKPVLIEANFCDGELDFHQLNNGPIFGKDTEIILAEIFARKRSRNNL